MLVEGAGVGRGSQGVKRVGNRSGKIGAERVGGGILNKVGAGRRNKKQLYKIHVFGISNQGTYIFLK